MNTPLGTALLGVALLGAAAASAQIEHIATVREVMEAVVAPSTDVLWAAEPPLDGERWQAIDSAAVAIIAAGTLIKAGGAGTDDREWAEQPDWAAFTDVMIAAAEAAREAARNEDFDALVASGEQIYAPCEGCHLVYHPEVRQD